MKLLYLLFVIATSVDGQQNSRSKPRGRMSVCQFSVLNRSNSISKQFDPTKLTCFDCSTETEVIRTLVPNKIKQQIEVCTATTCNGLLCDRNFTCHPPHKITARVLGLCTQLSRISGPKTPAATPTTQNSIPLIIGFAIGGVMLAVVIGGVFLGRARGNTSHDDSDIMTTPVSMSYSEWISNYSMGGARGSKGSNMRVEETEDNSVKRERGAVQVYNIVYGANATSPTVGGGYGPVVIEVDDTASLDGQPSFVNGGDMYGCNSNHFDNYVAYDHEDNRFISDVYIDNANYDEAQHKLINGTYCDEDNEQFIYTMDNGMFVMNGNEPEMRENSGRNSGSLDSVLDSEGEDKVFENNPVSLKHIYSTRKGGKSGKRISDSWSDQSWNEVHMAHGGSSEAVNDMLVALPVSPEGGRINAANLKHVFADVHRNMTISMENIILHSKDPEAKDEKRIAKFSISTTPEHNMNLKFKSQSDITECSSNKQLTVPKVKVERSFSVITKSKSMAFRREWARESVRRPSSCGSGEYTIPYGSIQFLN
ncbi:uncharacterized protein LOC100179717 [Ciona intestinalis]